ncbi:hypothetical protein ASF69_10320 [Rhizobium sp. Leaf311]|uniref:restriction endonuclease subunit S n=1 Tax=Rhizobium sp. Leaf311 TaxID=1736332 RepID=UPI0007158A63|nr:restriction endonuclease subunit S [Rhizobium sp. Leaf311]KQQ59542.1 hypothetical protein ASF69_10320 [Rhizobium sp. Leaf311]
MKPGYKQTEVGLIPEDWEILSLGEIGRVVRGGSPRPAGDKRFFNGSFIPWLTVGCLTNIPSEQLDVVETPTMLTAEGSRRSRLLSVGTMVIVNSGARTLGVTKVLGINCCANDGIAALVEQTAGHKAFICYFLNSQIDRLRTVVASGNDQLNLNTSRISQLKIPFPPELEQRSIAGALADVDAAANGLERLIAKKRDLKQATMQQLLTGQTRLPGFVGAWEMKRLGDHVTFLRNGALSRAQLTTDDPVRYLHYGDIHGSSDVFLSPLTASMPTVPSSLVSRLDRLQDGDLVFADASEDLDGVGKSTEIQMADSLEMVSGLHTIAARFDKDVLTNGFKAYLQFIPAFSAHLKKHASGTKVLATNRSHIASAELGLPAPTEQKAIALVFRDMDAELSSLKAQLDKTRLIKQAMMQELLTGRTRLPFQ